MNKNNTLILKKQMFSYFVTFGAGLVQIFSSIFLLRLAFIYLDLNELKLWFLIIAAVPLISMLELGANLTLPSKLSAIRKDMTAQKNIILCFLTISIGLAIILLVLTSIISMYAEWVGAISLNEFWLIIAFLIASIIRMVGNILQATLFSLGDNDFDKLLRIIVTGCTVLFAYIALFFDFKIYALPLSWALTGLISILVSKNRLKEKWKLIFDNYKINKIDINSLLKTSIQYLGFAIPGLLIFNSTAFIIAAKLPPESSVSFGLVQQIVAGVSLLATIPVTLSTASLAGKYISDLKVAQELLLKTLRLVLIISSCCLITIFINQEILLKYWLGKSVLIPVDFIALYFFMMVLEWQQSSFTAATMATGYFNFALITVLSGLLVTFSMPIFIHKYGLIGVPLAILMAQCMSCHPYNLYISFTKYKITLRLYVEKVLIKTMPAVLTLVIIYLVQIYYKVPFNKVFITTSIFSFLIILLSIINTKLNFEIVDKKNK